MIVYSFVLNVLSNILDDPIPSSRTVQPPMPFKINPSDPDASRRLYALHLSSATDQTLLSSIFGSECIESVQLEADPFIASEKQAEVIYTVEIKIRIVDSFKKNKKRRLFTKILLVAANMHIIWNPAVT